MLLLSVSRNPGALWAEGRGQAADVGGRGGCLTCASSREEKTPKAGAVSLFRLLS